MTFLATYGERLICNASSNQTIQTLMFNKVYGHINNNKFCFPRRVARGQELSVRSSFRKKEVGSFPDENIEEFDSGSPYVEASSVIEGNMSDMDSKSSVVRPDTGKSAESVAPTDRPQSPAKLPTSSLITETLASPKSQGWFLFRGR